jgi:hypothetical protein
VPKRANSGINDFIGDGRQASGVRKNFIHGLPIDWNGISPTVQKVVVVRKELRVERRERVGFLHHHLLTTLFPLSMFTHCPFYIYPPTPLKGGFANSIEHIPFNNA